MESQTNQRTKGQETKVQLKRKVTLTTKKLGKKQLAVSQEFHAARVRKLGQQVILLNIKTYQNIIFSTDGPQGCY